MTRLSIDDEGDEEGGRGRQRGHDRRAAPAVLVAAQEAEHEEEQAGGERRLAEPVDARRARIARLGHVRAGDPQAERAERQVDEEDPLPVEAARERAADERAEGERAADRRAVGGEGARALLRVRERVGEDRERHGEHHGRADALDGAGGVEEHDVGRRGARGRGQREDDEAGREQAAAAEAVGERPCRQHRRGQRERVRVHDPLQAAQPAAQVLGDPRERRVHHGNVKHQHRRGGTHHDEGPALRCHANVSPCSKSMERPSRAHPRAAREVPAPGRSWRLPKRMRADRSPAVLSPGAAGPAPCTPRAPRRGPRDSRPRRRSTASAPRRARAGSRPARRSRSRR